MQLNGLGIDVLDSDGHAAPAGDINIGRGGNIELVADRSGGNGSRCASQRLPLHCDGNGNGADGSASGDGDVAVELHQIPGAALIGDAAQSNDAGALAVDNAVGAGHRGFTENRVGVGGDLLHKYVGVLCQNNHSFRKKDSGEDISPRRIV